MNYAKATKEQLETIVLYEECLASEKDAAGRELMRRKGSENHVW